MPIYDPNKPYAQREKTINDLADEILRDASQSERLGSLRKDHGILNARRLRSVAKREVSIGYIRSKMLHSVARDD